MATDNRTVVVRVSGHIAFTHKSYEDSHGTEEREALEDIVSEAILNAVKQCDRCGWQSESSTFNVGAERG